MGVFVINPRRVSSIKKTRNMKNPFSRIFHRSASEARPDDATSIGLLFGNSARQSKSQALRLSAVYRCVDVISSSIAQLPLEVLVIGDDRYKHRATDYPAYGVITAEPNKWMTRYTFIQQLMISTLVHGNGYAYIRRDRDGYATALEFLRPGQVSVIDDERGHIMAFGHPNYGWIDPSDMIHVSNFSKDGEHGISTLDYALNAIELADNADAHARGFFKGGANLSGVVSINRVLTKQQKKDFLESWYKMTDPVTGKPNGVAIMEADMDYKPITVNPEQAQLLETRKYAVEDICRFFGVSPVKAYDLSKSSYSTIEATQLAFLSDTLQPWLTRLELELWRKIFLPGEKYRYEVKFNTAKIIRTDKTALADWYTKLYQLGVLCANDIRRDLDFEPIDGGDQAFVQSNLVPIDEPLDRAKAQQQGDPNASGSNNQEQDDVAQE